MSHEVQVGDVLDDRFDIIDVISRGGMASIFRGNDRKTGRPVALKVPYMQFESDPGFFTRFQREEAIGRTLDHPSIVRFIAAEDKSRPYIAMELLEGQTLRVLLHGQRRLPVPRALDIAGRICDALDHMHNRKVIHRDLKPENVMLCKDDSIRILDMGIAGAPGRRRLTFTGFSPAMGTPDYMAPEQVRGKRGDERTDIYGLGAMLYEMVTGSTPFEGLDPFMKMNARLEGDPVAPRNINPDIPPAVEEIILHAMERNPYDRYPDARAMKAELDAPETVPLTGRHERLKPPVLWRTRWRMIRLVVLAVLLPIIAFGVLWLVSRHPWMNSN
jgi:serine/threonine-protein kinase